MNVFLFRWVAHHRLIAHRLVWFAATNFAVHRYRLQARGAEIVAGMVWVNSGFAGHRRRAAQHQQACTCCKNCSDTHILSSYRALAQSAVDKMPDLPNQIQLFFRSRVRATNYALITF